MFDLVFVSITIDCIQIQELGQCNGNQLISPENPDEMTGHVGGCCFFQGLQVFFGQENIVIRQQIPGNGQRIGMAINLMGIGKAQWLFS